MNVNSEIIAGSFTHYESQSTESSVQVSWNNNTAEKVHIYLR